MLGIISKGMGNCITVSVMDLPVFVNTLCSSGLPPKDIVETEEFEQ